MKLGYARVSTTDQDLTIQRGRLYEAGCEKLFEEKISGARKMRPQLERLLTELRTDDVVVVTRLDRLARSTSELLRIAETIEEKNAGLQSIAEPWADTTSPAGRMVLTVFAGIAEFERSLIATRTEEGRRAAQARGVPFGRRPNCDRISAPSLDISSTKENPSGKSLGPSMSMSQRSIAAYTTRRPL